MSHKNTIKRKIIQLLEALPEDLYGFPGDFNGLRAAAFQHLVEWHEERIKLEDEDRDMVLEFVYPGADPLAQFYRELGDEVKDNLSVDDIEEEDKPEENDPRFN
jgi:hypothetical protein